MGEQFFGWVAIVGAAVAAATLLALIRLAFWLGKKSNEWDTTSNELDTIRDKLDKVVEKLSELIGVVQGGGRSPVALGSTSPVARENSPLHLTELGRAIAKNINADGIASQFNTEIKIGAEDSAYDIQESCLEFARKELPKKLEVSTAKLIGDEAFSQGVGVEEIYRVIGLTMRNQILEVFHSDLRSSSLGESA